MILSCFISLATFIIFPLETKKRHDIHSYCRNMWCHASSICQSFSSTASRFGGISFLRLFFPKEFLFKAVYHIQNGLLLAFTQVI